jgi:hypothetical protein
MDDVPYTYSLPSIHTSIILTEEQSIPPGDPLVTQHASPGQVVAHLRVRVEEGLWVSATLHEAVPGVKEEL